jgi:GTPase
MKDRQKFVILQVINPHYHQEVALGNMTECERLVATYGGEVKEKAVQHRTKPHPNTYIGPGKLEWLKKVVLEQKIEVVVMNALVKPSQLFRVEKALWEVNTRIKVWDRMDLILEIFDKHAVTKEAKLQIELAKIAHTGPRIYGLGRTVLSRQRGGIGQRGGFGETNIEFERRLMKERRLLIKKQLKKVVRQKKDRLDYRKEQGFGPVALVGYTSAGKTTLFNALTGKRKEVHEGLFTTLDTVVGKLKVPESQWPILISDTIGFIKDLPPDLIEAFKSTLVESLEAKLLLHVVDAVDAEMETKVAVVEDILSDLKVTRPVVLVFNKSDRLTNGQKKEVRAAYKKRPHFFISAQSGEGVADLKKLITGILISKGYETT